MKYLKGSTTEINGGMEYTSSFILAYDETEITEQEACIQAARRTRGSDWSQWDNDSNGFWSDDTLVKPFDIDREIPEKELKIAEKYLNVWIPAIDEAYIDHFNLEGEYIK